MNKKIILLAASVMFFVSCNKDTLSNNTNSDNIETITAKTSSPDNEDGTKTGLDDLTIKWSTGDKLYGFLTDYCGNTGVFTLSSGAGSSVAVFSGSLLNGYNTTFYYPQYGFVSLNKESESSTKAVSCNVVFHNNQIYVPNSISMDAMPMITTSISRDLQFNNLGSVIRLWLTGEVKVQRIILIANQYLAGNATVDIATETLSINNDSVNEKYVQLDIIGDEGQLSSTPKQFNIVIPPVSGCQFTVRILTDEGKMFEKTTQSITVAKNHLKPMPTLNVQITDNTVKYVEGDIIYDPVSIGGKQWSPVNCGSSTTNKTGRYYQWGRKSGLSYNYNMKAVATNVETPIVFLTTADGTYAWTSENISNRWEENTAERGEYDPCPPGWRVPTLQEYRSLHGGVDFSYSYCFDTQDGINGVWLDGEPHPNFRPLSDLGANKIFLPYCGGVLVNNASNKLSPGDYNTIASYYTKNTKENPSYPAWHNPHAIWQSARNTSYVRGGGNAMSYGESIAYPIRCIRNE